MVESNPVVILVTRIGAHTSCVFPALIWFRNCLFHAVGHRIRLVNCSLGTNTWEFPKIRGTAGVNQQDV